MGAVLNGLSSTDLIAVAAYGIAIGVSTILVWLKRRDFSNLPWADIESAKPYKLWLVQGERPAPDFPLVWYETDPRAYGLPALKPVTDEEYEAMADQIKVFRWAGDAVDFVYACGVEWSSVHGYRLVGGKYQFDQAVTNEVLNTDW